MINARWATPALTNARQSTSALTNEGRTPLFDKDKRISLLTWEIGYLCFDKREVGNTHPDKCKAVNLCSDKREVGNTPASIN